MESEEEENNQGREHNIPENNPSHGSSSSSDNSSSEELWSLCNLDIKVRRFIFWNMSVKSDILFNVMDIVSKLKDKGIPIIVPFCMIDTILFIYIYI